MAGCSFNSLAPGRSWCDFENAIFNLVLLIGVFKSSYDNVLRWMSQNLTDNKSTLVQVMAWCRQATSHNLNQCWPRSPTPYGVTRPQCVKGLDCVWHKSARSVPSHYLMWWQNMATSCRADVNSLGPSDAIWWQKTESTLAQVMPCCLTAPSHYLNRYWLIISKV